MSDPNTSEDVDKKTKVHDPEKDFEYPDSANVSKEKDIAFDEKGMENSPIEAVRLGRRLFSFF